MMKINFRVRRKDGRLIGYIRFESGRWQCQMLKAAGGSEEWSSGVLHGSTIEQYTGLKDKNGLEIYEGDIFHWGVHVAPVEFDHGYFAFAGMGLSPCNLQGEVIGDMYSNPELISPEGSK
jgi:uncharacterized phage protein (TIGR01671 family)